MADSEFAPLTLHLAKGLSDRTPDKRQLAALEIEKIVRVWLSEHDFSQLKALVARLQRDFTLSANPNARKGGLLALAATAVALGRESVMLYLPELVPPVAACFLDPDPKVRYKACEALFNIIKVARSSSLIFFKDIFTATAKLFCDSDANVRSCADTLNKLLMDVVRESPHFDVEVFIPLLRSHLYTNKPQTRQLLVSWVSLLQKITLLSLIDHLPEFLDGMFLILGDPNREISRMAEVVLGEFFRGLSNSSVGAETYLSMVNILVTHSQSDNSKMQFTALVWVKLFLEQAGRGLISMLSNILIPVLPCLASDKDSDDIRTIAITVNSHLRSLISPEDDNEEDPAVRVLTEADVTESQEEDSLEDRHKMADDVAQDSEQSKVLSTAEGLGVAAFHKTAEDVSDVLLAPPLDSTLSQSSTAPRIIKDAEWVEIAHSQPAVVAPRKKVFVTHDSSAPRPQLDLSAVLQVVLEHTLFTSTEIRTEALRWLVWLHQEIPRRLFRFGNVIIDSLMEILTDSTEEVIPLALRVVCLLCTSEAGLEVERAKFQKSKGASEQSLPSDRPFRQEVTSFFKDFLEKLLEIFAKDVHLLETKGSFIIRHLCVLVEPRCVYCLLAEILHSHSSLEFLSTAVQSLNLILITSYELFEMRMELKDLGAPNDWRLFTTLYQSWCHNPVATVTLCLITQNYEHASDLIESFGDINVTAGLLGELDRLIQLLESPIFTFLRLQILRPLEYPDLLRALYGILMLLPQSSTFCTLQQRLACVPALTTAQDRRPKRRQVRYVPEEVNFTSLLRQFKETQHAHREAQSNTQLSGIARGLTPV